MYKTIDRMELLNN